MAERRPLIIAGPTASGKSALALRIAERDGGCVINADASQVYGCWRVLTARPGDGDLARAQHRLYGHVGCGVRYSVGTWLRDIAPVLEEARRNGLRAIIVGGTGLYLTALTEGIAEIPEVSSEVRRRSEALAVNLLLEDLATLDPVSFKRIDRDNPRRVQRAWEVTVGTGRAFSEWLADRGAAVLAASEAECVVVEADIVRLNSAIRARFEQMVEIGCLEECRRYMAGEFAPDLPSGRVLGAPQLLAHLKGELGLDEAVELAVTATRQFAKRQRTWFRSRMVGWKRIDATGGGWADRI